MISLLSRRIIVSKTEMEIVWEAEKVLPAFPEG
jgi:hypothetical protein